jgi:hypothetical protein
MTTSKLPRTLGIAGLLIGLCLMATWFYIEIYNPFHLPTVQQLQDMTSSYSPPPLYSLLKEIIFIFLPVMSLSVFTIHAGPAANYALWILAFLTDGLILYCVGLLINVLTSRAGAHGTQPHEGTADRPRNG